MFLFWLTNERIHAIIQKIKDKGMTFMMQDLSYGRLENEFRNLQPGSDDLVICFQNHQILLKREEDNRLSLPTVAEVTPWTGNWRPWFSEGMRYVFRMQDQNYFLWL